MIKMLEHNPLGPVLVDMTSGKDGGNPVKRAYGT
jgi:hypothetical protein